MGWTDNLKTQGLWLQLLLLQRKTSTSHRENTTEEIYRYKYIDTDMHVLSMSIHFVTQQHEQLGLMEVLIKP